MAVAVMTNIPGGSAEQDDGIIQELGGTEDAPPPGALVRIAGDMEGGFRIISVWESQEAFDTFREEKLLPMFERRGMTIPNFQIWPLHSVRIAK